MATWDPFGIARYSNSSLRLHLPQAYRNPQPVNPINSGFDVKVGSTDIAEHVTFDQAREGLRSASEALANAFRGLTNENKPIYSTSIVSTSTRVASARGVAARLTPIVGAPSTLTSSAILGLDVTSAQSSSAIASTAEMNTATKSLSSYDIAFQNSTSRAQLSGAYTGSATSLKFKITTAADVTAVGSALSFDVLDQNNALVATFTGTVTTGQVIDVGNTGLKVRFTAGSLGMAMTSTVNVLQTATNVSTSAAFNAGWGSAPLFENFQTVTAGSFAINGVNIAVNANDSIDSVIARINSSNAGVTASVTGDKISLTTNSYSEDNIVFANDTSGFLAATKLSSATTTRGNVRDDEQVLSKTTQFAGVASGSFTVNGVSIAVNKDVDTLSSIISRINTSGAGVTADYDEAQDKVLLTTTSDSDDLITVAGDTTGFLTAASLSTNNTVTGALDMDPFESVLSDIAEYAAVAAGTITINGTQIAVDPSTTTLNGLMTLLNGVASVSSSLNENDGRVSISAASPDDVLTISDTSGLLTVLGITAGTFEGARGFTTVTQVQTGTTLESNATTVAANVSLALDRLNEALLQFGKVRESNGEFREEVEAKVRQALSSLTDNGADGLGVDRHRLANALTQDPSLLNGRSGIGVILSGIADKFAEDMAGLRLPLSPPSEPLWGLPAQLANDVQAHLAVKQAASTLALLISGRRKN